MTKLFGTDGIRGIVNKDLTAELAFKIGASVAKEEKESQGGKPLTFLVGGDTRISTDMLSSAVTSGVLSLGCNVINLGVMPTPAISYLTSKLNADGAFIISASHNPSKYNGIKVLNNNGYKLSLDKEEKIEELILEKFTLNDNINECGRIFANDEAQNLYIKHLLSTLDTEIKGLKVLVDTANGASYKTAKELFSNFDIDYKIINNNPDGYNINENAGSTHIDNLASLVKKEGYDVGIAYDGDADRCIMVDSDGEVVDGDYILAIASKYLKDKGKLKNNTLVGTVMSNLGLIKYCKQNNISFKSTKVGDKYVLDLMLKEDYVLGGEQSGHIIFKDYANTGDGQLTSLMILNIMCMTNKSLKELKNEMKKYPQVMINVEVSKDQKEEYKNNSKIEEKIKKVEKMLGNNGRILVRPSGTENIIRVMIEGQNENEITKICKDVATFIKKGLC